MVRLISRKRGGLAALKLTKLFGINDFPAAKDSGKVVIIIIYCYLVIIIIIIIIVIITNRTFLAHVRFGGISGEFGRAKIPMARPNEPDMPPKPTKKVRLGNSDSIVSV